MSVSVMSNLQFFLLSKCRRCLSILPVMQCGHGHGAHMPPPPPPRGDFVQRAQHAQFFHAHPGGGYFSPGCMGAAAPPGVWAPSGGPPGVHHPYARSRSPRRSHADELIPLISRCSPSDFRKVFNSLPSSLRSVAFEAPDDVNPDVKSIVDKEARMSMCRRINDLRRERLQALATPQTAQFYAEDGFKIVPMSRLTERHFWDLFHKLPITTTDAVKWKSVLKFLESCPEAPRGPPSSRDVEWASGELLDGPGLPVVHPPQHGGMDALRAMAVGSPSKPAPDTSVEFADWVKRRVDTDTANFTIHSFELDCENHRFTGRKLSASKALMRLSSLEAMSDLYQTVFQIYLRKLEKIIPKLGARSKENTALNKILDALNVSPDEKVAVLLARLRTCDIVRRPA